MLYNIRYATGQGSTLGLPTPTGYLNSDEDHLRALSEFISSWDPDVVGLVEVDGGSLRSKRRNQAECIADELGHAHTWHCKYPSRTVAERLPVLNMQGNAVLATDPPQLVRRHWFDRGVKRLVMEVGLQHLTVFLVHLSIHRPHRLRQLEHLNRLVRATQGPVIVAGDFNTLSGSGELDPFLERTGLASANADGQPSFPSWSPKLELDFILHSPELTTRSFQIPDVAYSDHLPLVADLEVPGLDT